jgi:hypothetical protein
VERSELIGVLGVSEHATTGEVRRARRVVARFLHPDADARSSTAMADVNAACDDWIAEIRSRRDLSPQTNKVVANQPSPPASNLHARPATSNRHANWLLTLVPSLVLFFVILGLVTAVAGPSVPTIAAGLLLGIGAGGFYAVASLLNGERHRNR